VDQDVEVASLHLLGGNRFASQAFASASARMRSASRPVIATRAPASVSAKAAPRAAPPLPTTRPKFSGASAGAPAARSRRPRRVGAPPLSRLAPHRVHRADTPRQRLDNGEIPH